MLPMFLQQSCSSSWILFPYENRSHRWQRPSGIPAESNSDQLHSHAGGKDLHHFSLSAVDVLLCKTASKVVLVAMLQVHQQHIVIFSYQQKSQLDCCLYLNLTPSLWDRVGIQKHSFKIILWAHLCLACGIFHKNFRFASLKSTALKIRNVKKRDVKNYSSYNVVHYEEQDIRM